MSTDYTIKRLIPKTARQLDIEAKRQASLAKANQVRAEKTRERKAQQAFVRTVTNNQLMSRIFAQRIQQGF